MELHQYPVALPVWLTTTNHSLTPFSRDTQHSLAQRAQTDARLADVVRELQEAIPAGSKEWELVERFCRDASKQLLESHAHFVKANHCTTEHNLLRLGAYRSDFSFAKFYQDLHLRVVPKTDEQLAKGEKQPAPLTEKDKRSASEAVRVSLPTVIELQPKVAVAFAQAIYRSQHWYDQQSITEALFEQLAEKEPRLVLTRFENFAAFANRQKIYDIAQAARANDPVEPLSAFSKTPSTTVQTDEAHLQMLEKNRPDKFSGLSVGVQRG